MQTHEFRAMNTAVLLAAEGRSARVAQGFARVEERIRAYEQRFSRFLAASELSRLNSGAGAWQPVSADMLAVLSLAQRLHAETDGLFDPAILPALEQAGYRVSMDEIRSAGGDVPGGSALSRPALRPAFRDLQLDAQGSRAFLPAGLRIDLGGLAKGWIVEQAAHLLGCYANACLVDAGGDMFSVGLPQGETRWPVAIEDPFDPSREIALLALPAGAVATSTTTRRSWTQNGQPRHHLIDPRSGQPAEAAWVSVTVVARHSGPAEVLAKALLIGGPELADSLLAAQPGAEYFAVDPQGSLWGSTHSSRLMADAYTFNALQERIL